MSGTLDRSGGRFDILLVCTGNQCRSPMAAAILSRLLSERGSEIKVGSAGFVSEGTPSPTEVGDVMKPLGYDLSGHRSRPVSLALLESAHLVLGMTRQHVIDLSLLDPSGWPRTFTLTEVIRLGRTLPARRPDEPLPSWVARIGAGRHRAGILDLPLSEDVPDPVGKPLRAYVRTRDHLSELTTRLADLLQPV
jgi:protein-tyrosine phosphatase